MEREFPRGTDSARLIEIIETKSVRGSGCNTDSPCRTVTQYWSKTGVLLAENDPFTKEKE